MTGPEGRAPRVLIWTEAHWVGGCDRFLVDLLRAIPAGEWRWRLAGIPLVDYDAWLARRLPAALPRITRHMASLPGSPLASLPARLAGDAPAPALSADDAAVPLAVRAAVAALRYRHAATNLVRLRRLLRGARPDVLFINNGGYPGGESCRYAALAAKAEGVPRVVHFVHNMAYEPNWPPVVERAVDRRVDAAVDAWATAATRATARLAAVRGMDPAHCHTVHYGIPPAPSVQPASREGLGFRPGALAVALVAALEPRKGHLVALDAVAELARREVEVDLALVGEGPELERVRGRIGALGLTDRVHVLGRRDDVDAILAAADAVVLPSLSNECLPYAILEAMAHGLAVVGTDVAGIPDEVVDGETGYVVAPGDASMLADRLARLAADPARRRAMGAAGRDRAATTFPIDGMVDQVTALWRGDAATA